MGLGSFVSRQGRKIYNGTGDLTDGVGDAWNDFTGKTASRDAANILAGASDKAGAVQQSMLDKTLALNEPWRQAGIGALGDLAGGLKSGAFTSPEESFSYDMPKTQGFNDPGFNFNFREDPGYAFRAAQQDQAVERSAAASGGLFSGATLSDLASKRGEMASQEYGNAYNRERGSYENSRDFGYKQNRDQLGDAISNRNFAFDNFTGAQDRKRLALSDRFNRLSTLAGLGEAATSRSGQATTQYGQQAGQNISDKANALAGGRVGGYNSQRDTVMGLGNLAMKGAGIAYGS